MKVINPATEAVIKEIPEDDGRTLANKFARLNRAQSSWAETPLEARIAILRRFSELLEEDAEDLAMLLTSEVGKPLKQSMNELAGARARIKWLTDNAAKYLCPEVMSDSGGMKETIIYEPLGVVCNISAWNYPYLVGTNVFVPALRAGNAVMYKPSEYATLTGFEIERCMHEAGVPTPVFECAVGGKEVGEELLKLDFDGYFFTGSYKTGKHIYDVVSQKMVPCQCELGGKDPIYIADDIADIKAVATGTADGAFYNNRQSCCAVERIYVHEKIYDAYVQAFVEEVKGYKMGQPTEPGIYLGPLTRKDQLDVLEQQIEKAVKGGARLLTGGQRVKGKGYYFEPTVLADVNNHMTVMQEESFGPVIGIMRVTDDAEAVKKMSDTEYGLTAGVYSASEERAVAILKHLNTGTCYWNCCDRVSAAVPWSGRQHSGFGATLSHAGLRAFTRPKALHLRRP